MKNIILVAGLLGALAHASTDSPRVPGSIELSPTNKSTHRVSIEASEDERNKRDILSFLQNKYFGKNQNDGIQNVGYSKEYKTHQDKINPDYPNVPNQNDLVNAHYSKSFGAHDGYDNLNLDYSDEFRTRNKLNIPNLDGVSIYRLQKDKIPNTQEYRLIGFGAGNAGDSVPTVPKTYSNSNTFRTGSKILSVSEIIEQNRSNRYGTNKNNNAGIHFGTEHMASDFERNFDMSNNARRPMGWIDSWTPPWKSFDSQPIRIEPGFRRSFRGYGFDEWGGQGFTR